jgi:hypothetical protein
MRKQNAEKPSDCFTLSTQELDRSGSAAVFAGGIRVYITKSVFVSGDESWRGFFNDQRLGSLNAMLRVAIGISFWSCALTTLIGNARIVLSRRHVSNDQFRS